MKKIALGICVVVAVAGLWFWQQRGIDRVVPYPVQVAGNEIQFSRQKKSAHFETSTPSHGKTLPGVPLGVVIDFNFDLGPGSKISIQHDGKEYGSGETTIDRNLLALRRNMDSSAPDGLYSVRYSACWPDGSCHDGNFEFVVDRSREVEYVDMTGKTEIEVELKNVAFDSKNIRVSRGTKVTWINRDPAVHYINTDSHPAHTYYPLQNSRALKQGDTYTVIFDTPGFYPYHCSAHADGMRANILVE